MSFWYVHIGGNVSLCVCIHACVYVGVCVCVYAHAFMWVSFCCSLSHHSAGPWSLSPESSFPSFLSSCGQYTFPFVTQLPSLHRPRFFLSCVYMCVCWGEGGNLPGHQRCVRGPSPEFKTVPGFLPFCSLAHWLSCVCSAPQGGNIYRLPHPIKEEATASVW